MHVCKVKSIERSTILLVFTLMHLQVAMGVKTQTEREMLSSKEESPATAQLSGCDLLQLLSDAWACFDKLPVVPASQDNTFVSLIISNTSLDSFSPACLCIA